MSSPVKSTRALVALTILSTVVGCTGAESPAGGAGVDVGVAENGTTDAFGLEDGALADTAPNASPATLDEACDEFAQASCSWLSLCTEYWLRWFYGSQTTCVTRSRTACLVLNEGADAASLSACVRAYVPHCDLDVASACPAVFDTRPNGAGCGRDGDCESMQCRFAKVGDACGRCEDYARDGEPCGESSKECAPGRRCSEAGICSPRLGEGEACSGFFACSYEFMCFEGECVRPLAPGDTCDPDRPRCQCEPSTKTCERPWNGNFVGLGAPCGPDANPAGYDPATYISCEGQLRCEANAGGQYLCVPALADGASCVDDEWDCALPADCIDGVCKIPVRETCPP
jgi:hypothetical protein